MSISSFCAVKEIWQKDLRTLAIVWTDDKESECDVVALRRHCPCAECVDETTGKRKIAPEQISDGTRPLVIRSVGRYAMAIEFSDGHKTGIYSFDFLRRFPRK
jgi:DUF971 family protein